MVAVARIVKEAILAILGELVLKGSRVESIEDARKEYKKLLEEGWKKTSIFKSYF